MCAPANELVLAAQGQCLFLRRFFRDTSLRPVVVTMWVMAAGAALHAPVAPYFFEELNATKSQIGDRLTLTYAVSALTVPLYGHMLDSGSVRVPIMLASFFCAAGCTLIAATPVSNTPLLFLGAAVVGLGGANLETVAKAYVACATPITERAAVLSSFSVQITLLDLMGKFAYPAWDWGLSHADFSTMDRYRVTMGVCPLFCSFGVFWICMRKGALQDAEQQVQYTPVTLQPQLQPMAASGDPGSWAARFSVTLFALFVFAAFQRTLSTVWPYWLQDRYSWRDRELAVMQLCVGLAQVFLTALYPVSVERRAGGARAAAAFAASAAALTAASFPSGDGVADKTVHCVCFPLLYACAFAIRPCLEAVGSLRLPRDALGTAFGLMAAAQVTGTALGSSVAMRVYDSAVRGGDDGVLTGGGRLPFVVCGGMAAVTAALLLLTARGDGAPLPVTGTDSDRRLDDKRGREEDSGVV